MSTSTPTTEPKTTRARIEVTDTPVAEVRSFATRRDRDVYFEHQGGRTYLVAVEE